MGGEGVMLCSHLVSSPFSFIMWSSAGCFSLQQALLRITQQNRHRLFIWNYRAFYYWNCHKPVCLIMCVLVWKEERCCWFTGIHRLQQRCVFGLTVCNISTDLHLVTSCLKGFLVTVDSGLSVYGKTHNHDCFCWYWNQDYSTQLLTDLRNIVHLLNFLKDIFGIFCGYSWTGNEGQREKDIQQRAAGWNRTRGRCSEDTTSVYWHPLYQLSEWVGLGDILSF